MILRAPNSGRFDAVRSDVAAPVESRVDLRAWAMAALAGWCTFDFVHASRYGVAVAALVLLTGKPSRIRIDAVVLFSAAYVGWMAVSALWAVGPVTSEVEATGAMAIIFLGFLDFLDSREKLKFVAVGYLAGTVIAVGRSVLQHGGSLLADSLDQRYSVGQLNANYLAYSLSAGISVVVLLWVLRKEDGLRQRWWLFAVLLVLLVGVQRTGTRGAYLDVLTVVAWLICCTVLRRPPWRLLVAAAVLVSCGVVLGIAQHATGDLEPARRHTGDWSGRTELWALARSVWSAHPFRGAGAGGFEIQSPYHLGAHNVLLEVGANLGLVGLALFLGIFLSALRRPAGSDPRRTELLLGTLLLGSLWSYLTGYWELSPPGWIVLAMYCRALRLGRGPADVGAADALEASTAPAAIPAQFRGPAAVSAVSR